MDYQDTLRLLNEAQSALKTSEKRIAILEREIETMRNANRKLAAEADRNKRTLSDFFMGFAIGNSSFWTGGEHPGKIAMLARRIGDACVKAKSGDEEHL